MYVCLTQLLYLTTRWEETLLIDEAVERLVALDALVLFEVLQQPINVHR